MYYRMPFLVLTLGLLLGSALKSEAAISKSPDLPGPNTVRLVPQYCLGRDRPEDPSRPGKSTGETLDTCLIDGALFNVLCREDEGYAFGPQLGQSLYAVETGRCAKLVDLMLERKPFTVILDGDMLRFE